MLNKVNVGSVVGFLVSLFLIRPNLAQLNPFYPKVLDVIFLGLLFIAAILAFGRKKVFIDKYFFSLVLALFFSMLCSVALTNFTREVYFKDLFELARPIIFMLFPFLLGYNTIRANRYNLIVVSKYMNITFYLVVLVAVLQLILGYRNSLFTLYSQEGVFFGRATGTALYITEYTFLTINLFVWSLYFTIISNRSVKIVKKLKYFSLLSLSKASIVLFAVFMLITLPFSRRFDSNKKSKLVSIISFVFLFFIIYGAMLLIQTDSFQVSILEAFSVLFDTNTSDRSVGNRYLQLEQQFNYIFNANIIELLFGYQPLGSHIGVRAEISNFNNLSKIGLVGIILMFSCYLYALPLVLKSRKDKIIRLFSFFIFALSFSAIISGFASITYEGVKSTFLLFFTLGCLSSYCEVNNEYS